MSNHKYTIHKVPNALKRDEWRVQCPCGWKEKAHTMKEASDRGLHHVKYPNR